MKMATGRITIAPATCGGRPFFSGTRVPVYVVLEMFANRENHKEILSEFPDLTPEDLKDALTFARNVAEIPGNPAVSAA